MKFRKKYCCISAFPLKYRNAEHTSLTQVPCLHVNERGTYEGNINFIYISKIDLKYLHLVKLPLLIQNT